MKKISKEKEDFENGENEGDKIYDVYEYKKLNHIEKMDLIDRNQDLQEQLYEKFKVGHQHLAETVVRRKGIKSFDYSNAQSINIQEIEACEEKQVKNG